MPFLVEYLQDIPKDCGECPCSIHITPKEVYCNARQKHFEVTDRRPDECKIIERSNVINSDEIEEKNCGNCIYSLGRQDDDEYIICALATIGVGLHKVNSCCLNWKIMGG